MQITPELVLLRTALASPSLRPGAVVAARVLDRGVLSLLGARVPATPPVMLPGGATARVIHEEDEQEGGGARGERAVTLRYDSATLGRLDIKVSTAGA